MKPRIFQLAAVVALALPALAACSGSSGGGAPYNPATQPAHCTDGVKNSGETDVDCGGECLGCANGKTCALASDCGSGLCGNAYTCLPAACGDGNQGVGETGTDCGGSCPACFGEGCAVNADCATGFCNASVCDTPSCTDAQKNGRETDVDCGGDCPQCTEGKGCKSDGDCDTAFCNQAGVCAVPSCDDGETNQDETDVDCGGATCGPCADGLACVAAGDCESTKCNNNVCGSLPAECSNGAKDDGESDVDCGGVCAPCGFDKACGAPTDCKSGICTDSVCSAPASCLDAELTAGETDVDCGGTDCPPCAVGKTCLEHTDCYSIACIAGLCEPASCTDEIHNGLETDVDCGGPDCDPCEDSKMCKEPGDCQGGNCTGGYCGSCTDGVENGDETDVDCGGDTCPACDLGKSCVEADDCLSGGCDQICCTPNACGFCGELGAETCNGKDDDCDGSTDNGLAAQQCDNQKGVCAGAMATCKGSDGWQCDAAVFGAHSASYEAAESSCDMLDNDCNGQTDESGCQDCSAADVVEKGSAESSGEMVYQWDWFTMHGDTPAVVGTKNVNRPGLRLTRPGDTDEVFVDLANGGGVASDGVNFYFAYRESLGGERVEIKKWPNAFDYVTIGGRSDVPSGSHPTPIAVGGGKGIVAYVNENYAQKLLVSDTLDFGASWTEYTIDDAFDSAIAVAADAQGHMHAVWRSGGQGNFKHWVDGTATDIGGTGTGFDVAIHTDGSLHLLYQAGTGGLTYRAYAGGSWSTPEQVVGNQTATLISVAVSADGTPYAAYRSGIGDISILHKSGGSWVDVTTRSVSDSALVDLDGIQMAIVGDKNVVQLAVLLRDANLPGKTYPVFLTTCKGYGDPGPVCTPSCGGKECGDDGCGGSCGSCPSGETCTSAGLCEGGVQPSQCGADTVNTCAGKCGLYSQDWPCACDADCATNGDCCPDLADCCVGSDTCGPAGASSCSGRCGEYVETNPCNCDDACYQYNDCCVDWVVCGCAPQ